MFTSLVCKKYAHLAYCYEHPPAKRSEGSTHILKSSKRNSRKIAWVDSRITRRSHCQQKKNKNNEHSLRASRTTPTRNKVSPHTRSNVHARRQPAQQSFVPFFTQRCQRTAQRNPASNIQNAFLLPVIFSLIFWSSSREEKRKSLRWA